MITISIAKDFSKTPGFRFKTQSPGTSGEEFRDALLSVQYAEAKKTNEKLRVILDGTNGLLTSFLEEAFGGLQEKLMEEGQKESLLDTIDIVSNEEKHWVTDIEGYVKKALDGLR